MFRYALMAVLAMGVVGGYGSAVARAAYWRGHGGCHSQGSWGAGRWHDPRFDSRFEERTEVKQQAPTPAPQPQTVVVQQPAAAPAPAPQIFLIMPGGQPVQPQTVVVPTVSAPVVATPAAVQPAAQPQ